MVRRKLLSSNNQPFTLLFTNGEDKNTLLTSIDVEEHSVLAPNPKLSLCKSVRPERLYILCLNCRIVFQHGHQRFKYESALLFCKPLKIVGYTLFKGNSPCTHTIP